MLKCIKAGITPASCKLKKPLKTRRSYDIIHKAEKQLLCERIRNINSTLDMFEQNRSQYYSHLENMINQYDQEIDIGKCIQFINKRKEHRHSKIKNKHIDKFKCLYFKRFGYHHNFTRNSQFLNNTDCALSGQSNVPSSISTTSSSGSGIPSVPATPMASTPSSSMDSAPRHPSSSSRHTCKTDDHTKKWVINLSQTPLTPGQLSLLQKGPNFAITPKYPPWKPT